jgi:biopolymer transport protein ExbD
MNEFRALAHVQKEIAKIREEQVLFLAADRATSYEEYKKVCGVIRGLNLTDQFINDLVQKMENDDE